jgi:hypothetical protein
MGRLFNGSSDSIDKTSISGAGSALTVAFWFNPASTAAAQHMVSGTGFYVATGGSATINYSGVITGSATLSVGTWYHIALTTSGSTGNAYFSGASDGSSVVSAGSLNNGDHVAAGDQIGGGNYTNGSLADVAIWNVALSSSDIAKLAAGYRPVDVNSANLVLWWPLSGYSSPEPDISGNANNGTLTGTSQAPMPPSLGRGGRSFAGASTSIITMSTGGTTTLELLGVMSVSYWVNLTAQSGCPLGNFGSSQGPYICDINSGKPRMWNSGAGPDATSTTALSNGLWYHVLTVRTGSSGNWTIKFWVNGVAAGTTTGITTNPISSAIISSFALGQLGSFASSFLSGSLADVALWNVDVSSSVAQLAAGVHPGSVNSANLVGWWPLDGSSNSIENDRSVSGNNGTVTGPLPILGPPQLWRLG